MTMEYRLMCMIRTILENSRFFVELGGKRSRWRSQRNGVPQGSALAPLLFNVYTNDQPIHPGTRSFVYADDLAVTTQSTDFAPIEDTLTSALAGLSEYYTTNQLRANSTKAQVSLFHLRNRECGKQLNISWNGVNLTHCNLLVYLGVTLDRTLSYKAHIEKTKKKVGTRNNILLKLRTSKWGDTPTTLRSSALALCYFRNVMLDRCLTVLMGEPERLCVSDRAGLSGLCVFLGNISVALTWAGTGRVDISVQLLVGFVILLHYKCRP